VYDPTDPAHLTPEQRADEVASILATGYLRHRRLRAAPSAESQVQAAAPATPEPGRSRENELDGPEDQSVHVPHADGP
jgi:hypothetical protein